jgi:hypothetical protein
MQTLPRNAKTAHPPSTTAHEPSTTTHQPSTSYHLVTDSNTMLEPHTHQKTL